MNKAGRAITKILTGIMGVTIVGCAGIIVYSQIASPDTKYEILENFANRNVSENTVSTSADVSGSPAPSQGTDTLVTTNTSTNTGTLADTSDTGSSVTAIQPEWTDNASDVSNSYAAPVSESVRIANARDARKTASLVTGIDASRITFYSDLTIDGASYYAFDYTNSAGQKMNPAIVVAKSDGKTYYYDFSGGLKNVWTLGNGEIYTGPVGNDSFISDDPDFSVNTDGSFSTRGIYCGLSFDQTIDQLLRANGIPVDEDRLQKCAPAYMQSGDLNEAIDMIGVGSQTLFGFPCEIKINFNKMVDTESRKLHTTPPTIEEISIGFISTPGSYDASRYVSKQMNRILGKPSETFQNDTVLSFQWNGIGNTAVLTYVYSPEIDDYALRSLRIESNSHITKTKK